MRVGVFIPTLNVYGGAEYVAIVIANALAQNGYQVVLFTNNRVNRQEIGKFFTIDFDSSIKVIVKPSLVRP